MTAVNDELAAAVKAWRGKATQSEAAALLGISKRTLEGIEQGRGIAYPSLLLLAIKAIKPQAAK
jgi:DNA-binding XRE family transcriptional regulator